MADVLHTSVTVEFGNPDDSGDLVWEKDPDRAADGDNEVYMRLYPSAPERMIVTSGSLSKRGTDAAEKEEYLVFEGETTQPVGFSNISDLVLQQVGGFYDADGKTTAVNITYDPSRNLMRADKVCYGVVNIRYKAPYQSYLFAFAGEPCDLAFIDGAYTYTGGYTLSVLIAINIQNKATATTKLVPEECGASRYTKTTDDAAGLANIVLEMHKDFPARITGFDLKSGAVMSCKVRQIPDVQANIDMSSGTYKLEPFLNTAESRKRNDSLYSVSNYSANNTEIVKDIMAFNSGYSGKLKYQPHRRVLIKTTGPFLDVWGNTISPTFAQGGDEIVEVEWLSENTYTNPRRRIVEPDEIVALTSGNKTVKVYGSIKMEYAIQFKVFDVTFNIANQLKPEDGYENIHMLADYDGQTEYLFIEAPSIKET